MLSLPSDTAPASARRCDTVDSYGGTNPRRILEAQVVSTPRVTKISLMPIGTPASGPGSRPAGARGVDRVGAAARAVGVDQHDSSRARRRAAPMRSRYASVTSRARSLPARTPSAIAAIELAARLGRITGSSSPAPPAGPGTMRGTWKKLASRRGAFCSASSIGSDGATWSGRSGQSNGTAWVIGSTADVSRSLQAAT